ncbi:MAG: hypothetical protein ABH827_01655 [bacterium]
MKNHIIFSLAFIFCITHHISATKKPDQSNSINYTEYKNQRSHIFKHIKTQNDALNLLEKEAEQIQTKIDTLIKSQKIINFIQLKHDFNDYALYVLSLFPCYQPYEREIEEQDEIEEEINLNKNNIEKSRNILIHHIHFIFEEILNLDACKLIKEKNSTKIEEFNNKFKKIYQQKDTPIEEHIRQTLNLASQAKTLILTSLIKK